VADEALELVISAKDEATSVLSKVVGSLGTFGKAVGVAAAAATAGALAMYKITKEAADFQDEMIKAAQRANVGVTEFSDLAHAASLADVSMEELQSTLSRMNRAISEASYGVKTYTDEFDHLGITIKNTDGTLKTSKDVLYDLADSIEKNGVNADIMSAGMAIAGRGFANMIPLLQGGSAAMRAAAADARYLGVEIGERAAQQAEYFNDSLTRLSSSIKGVAISVGNQWMPFMTGLVRIATDAVVGLRKGITDWAGGVIKNIVLIWAYGEQVFSNIKKIITLSFSIKDVTNWVNNVIESFPKVLEAAVIFAQSFGEVLLTAYKIAWEAFVELGKWAFQKVFDFFTGKDLADDFIKVLTERIPEATANSVAEMQQKLGKLKDTAADVGNVVAEHLMTAFGLSADEAKKRADQIIQHVTEVGTRTAESTKKATEDETLARQKALEAYKALLDQRASMVDQSLLGETERINMETEIQLVNLQLAEANKLITKEQYMELLNMATLQANARLGDIIAGAELNRLRVSKMTMQNQLNYTADSLGSITQLMGSENKKQFAIGKAASIAQAIIQTYTAATNAYQSASGIPIVGWILGPIAAAAAVAFGLAQVSKIKSQQPPGGQAHAGMTNVPSEGSFLLDKGERVLMPEQNRDLTAFLNEQNAARTSEDAGAGAGGAPVIIQKVEIHILENATNASALLDLSRGDWERLATDKIVPALNIVGRMGVKPEYIQGNAR